MICSRKSENEMEIIIKIIKSSQWLQYVEFVDCSQSGAAHMSRNQI